VTDYNFIDSKFWEDFLKKDVSEQLDVVCSEVSKNPSVFFNAYYPLYVEREWDLVSITYDPTDGSIRTMTSPTVKEVYRSVGEFIKTPYGNMVVGFFLNTFMLYNPETLVDQFKACLDAHLL